jgi:hypothetical protein
MQIQNVNDDAFRKYGKVIKGIDVSDILEAMKETPCPDDTMYTPSDPKIEACESVKKIQYSVYGGMPIEVGYCNGHNKKLNAAEYHRDSETNIACNDMVLILGQLADVAKDFTYDTSRMEAFLVPKGTMIEVYATTLHYAPCNVEDCGFRAVVVLPEGTNTEIETGHSDTPEDRLLFARNKWLIAHPDAGIEGAWNGLKGANLSID